jgi:cis-3-alkyl-4-acyloxetan-2-one decarboxylase
LPTTFAPAGNGREVDDPVFLIGPAPGQDLSAPRTYGPAATALRYGPLEDVMIGHDETFDGTFPFPPHFSEAPGFRMHFVDEGAGSPLVCLHGQPTWGYLYRKFIGPLAGANRVVVPDHMGFGKSETPQDREYTLRTHVDNLTALLDDLGLTDITFVAQDWGGNMAVAYTLRHPERVKRLCLMNTMSGYGVAGRKDVPPVKGSRWFRWIDEGYESGRTEAVLTNLGSTVVDVMKIIGFENSSAIDDAWIRAYSAPFPTPEACKGALEFPLDIHLDRIRDYMIEGYSGIDALKSKPAMFAVGMKDRAIPPETAIADFNTLWPEAPVVELPNAGHFCQEDAPETLVALIQQFLQLTR